MSLKCFLAPFYCNDPWPTPSSPRPSSLALVFAQIHTELLELAVQVRALQSRLLRHPRHAAVLTRQVILEVRALEGIAGIT